MSNHNGSYILHDTLYLLKNMDIFKEIGIKKTREFTLELIKLGRRYDGNPGEILQDIGEDIGICYYCLHESNDMKYGLCKECRKEK